MANKLALRPPVAFAHPSEARIARLLDFYHVRWEYEPRSFELEWGDDGRPIKSFTPDFYLPDYDLYLEVTTVRPSLTSKKNRKVRLLREIYPDIQIKLLTLRDVEALMLKYGLHPEEPPQPGAPNRPAPPARAKAAAGARPAGSRTS